MPQFLWPSFSGGILGPQSIGRIDVQGYARAARDILNFIVDLRGGLIKRPGTWNVPISVPVPQNLPQPQTGIRSIGKWSSYYDPILRTYRLKLIPFIFDVHETRLVVFTSPVGSSGGAFLVFKFNYEDRDSGQDDSLSAIPYCIGMGTHEYANPQLLKYAQINDVLYLASPERPFSKMVRRGSASRLTYIRSAASPPTKSPVEEYHILPVSLGLSLMYHPSKQKHSNYHIDIGGPHEIPHGWPILQSTSDYENYDENLASGAGTRTSRAYSGEQMKPPVRSITDIVRDDWTGNTFPTGSVPPQVQKAGNALGLDTAQAANPNWYALCYVVEPDWTNLGTKIVGGTLILKVGDETHRLPIVGSRNWIYELTAAPDNGLFVFTIIVVKKNAEDEKLPDTKQYDWRIENAAFEGDDITMSNPRAVAVHEQRLWVAGTSGDPSAIWASAVRDYENFVYEIADEEELKDSDPLKFTLAANNQDPIYWLQPSNGKLFAGTSETVYILQGDDQTGITPTSIKVTSDSRIGTRNMQPVVVGDAIIAPYRTGQQLQILGYRFETDSFQSINMNLLCGEITRPGIRALAWQQEPYQCLWCVMRDGSMATYTMDTSTAEGGTRAWARHVSAGANFIDACSLPYIGKYSYDCMFFLVDRGAPGTEGNGEICLEYMPLDRGFWGFGVVDACRSEAIEQEGFVEVRNGVPLNYPTRDSLFTYDPPGMHVPPPYLRDWVMKETQIGADASFTEYGVPIFAKLETLPSEVYDPSHAFLGMKKKRPGTVIVRVLNTWDLKLNGDNIFSRLVFQYGYERAKVLDGLLRWNNFGWTHEGTLRIVHDEAFPCHILTVGYRLDVGGDD